MSQPHTEYSQRLQARQQTVSAKDAQHKRIGNAKLAVVVATLVLLWLSLKDEVISAHWLALPIVIYAALALAHEFALRALAHARTAVAFYQRGLARMEDRWAGTGASGERFRNPKHVYADDLDLFGAGCLFELLSTARLPMGEERLAQWLTAASPVPAILERQKVIVELRDKLDLREELALLDEDLKVRLDPRSLETWAEAPPLLPTGPWRSVAALLAISAAATTIYLLATLRLWPLAIVFAFEVLVLLWLRQRAEKVVSALACNAEGLGLFADILRRLEREPFASRRLQDFATQLKSGRQTASQSVKQLANIVYWIDAREDLLGRLLELPMLYTVQCAFAAEAWCRRHGGKLRAWVDIAAEMEALLSLAGYSYEHPDDPFPEFTTRASEWASGFPRRRAWPSFDSISRVRAQFCAARRADPRASCQRLEHVRQKHLSARGGNQRSAGACRSAHSRQIAAPDAHPSRHQHSPRRFAPGASLKFLHRNSAHPRCIRADRRRAARPVPVR